MPTKTNGSTCLTRRITTRRRLSGTLSNRVFMTIIEYQYLDKETTAAAAATVEVPATPPNKPPTAPESLPLEQPRQLSQKASKVGRVKLVAKRVKC